MTTPPPTTTEIGGHTEELLEHIAKVEEAATHHLEWLRRVHRLIVCRQPPEPALLKADAHHRCAFGRWYDGVADANTRDTRAYPLIGDLHREVHRKATSILEAHWNGLPFTEEEYDAFMVLVTSFNEALRLLQGELWRKVSAQDALTGLRTRHLMLHEIRHSVERDRPLGAALSGGGHIGLCDIDFFKKINDRYGHPAGDQVLKTVAQRITAGLRQSDLIYRYGGEEFLFFLPSLGATTAWEVCDRLRANIAAQPVLLGDGHAVPVTLSFGLAELPWEGEVETVIAAADQALYRAKAEGRNRVEMAGMPS